MLGAGKGEGCPRHSPRRHALTVLVPFSLAYSLLHGSRRLPGGSSRLMRASLTCIENGTDPGNVGEGWTDNVSTTEVCFRVCLGVPVGVLKSR
jgi:hypothetical protein